MIMNEMFTEVAPIIPLAVALKEATADLHVRAEKHPVQSRFVTGKATAGEYAAFLGQMAAIHDRLEPMLRMQTASLGPLANTVQRHHYRSAAVRADLDVLGQSAEAKKPLPATLRFSERLQELGRRQPLALLGVLYVLEGATNGGRFIAAAVRPALGLPNGAGTAYLDPHGENQRERWAEFRASLDAQVFNSSERNAVIAAACETFTAIYDILEDLDLRRCSHT